MFLKSVFAFTILAPCFAIADASYCTQFFLKASTPLVRTDFRIEFGSPTDIKLMRKINRIFIEYPREYMENTRTVAKVTVPESRWKEIFGESYESVIEQLLQIKIYKIEIFEDGTQIINFDTNFLVSYGNTNLKFYPNEWIRDQPAFSFQFDRRILNLIEFHLESAHVAAILSHGIIDRIETGPVTLY